MHKANLELFNERLAHKPYFSEDPRFGAHVAGKVHAILAGYVQCNQLHGMCWLGFGTDRAGAAIDWSDRNTPVPTMTITYHEKRNTHLLYALKNSIFTAPEGKHYAVHVEDSLRSNFEACTVFSGLIYKNSGHGYWKIAEWLVDFFDSNTANDKQIFPGYSLSRNNTLFDKTRKWSCLAIRQDWPQVDQWQQVCYERAYFYKLQFSGHLVEREIHNIVKCIVKLTYGKFSKPSFNECVAMLHTPYAQVTRGRKSHVGESPIISRVKINEITFFRKMNKSIIEIAGLLNLSVGCVFKHIKEI